MKTGRVLELVYVVAVGYCSCHHTWEGAERRYGVAQLTQNPMYRKSNEVSIAKNTCATVNFLHSLLIKVIKCSSKMPWCSICSWQALTQQLIFFWSGTRFLTLRFYLAPVFEHIILSCVLSPLPLYCTLVYKLYPAFSVQVVFSTITPLFI